MPEEKPTLNRVGVYADLVYRSDGATISTDRAFIRFVTSMPPRVGEVVLFGRLDPRPGREPYALPSAGVRFVPLPFYRRATDLLAVLRAVRGSCARFSATLDELDAVWIFGPHPPAVLFALIARARRRSLFLGVRQDYPEYIRGRLPNRRWGWAVVVARLLDGVFRYLSERAPTITVGEELARRYGRGEAPVLATGLSLVSASEVVSLEQALARRWDGKLRVLSVGRLDPEKNPLLLIETIAILRRSDPRWVFEIVGDGPLRDAVRQRAVALGVGDAVTISGYVPNGPDLWRRYRASHAFLHVSHTEGLPQVLFEAQAAGLPIVATDVGGVAAALGNGERGLLVAPGEPHAAVAALRRLAADETLRRTLIEGGLEHAAQETMEAQLDRVAAFLRASHNR